MNSIISTHIKITMDDVSTVFNTNNINCVVPLFCCSLCHSVLHPRGLSIDLGTIPVRNGPQIDAKTGNVKGRGYQVRVGKN